MYLTPTTSKIHFLSHIAVDVEADGFNNKILGYAKIGNFLVT